jgi:hypothetical protein
MVLASIVEFTTAGGAVKATTSDVGLYCCVAELLVRPAELGPATSCLEVRFQQNPKSHEIPEKIGFCIQAVTGGLLRGYRQWWKKQCEKGWRRFHYFSNSLLRCLTPELSGRGRQRTTCDEGRNMRGTLSRAPLRIACYAAHKRNNS